MAPSVIEPETWDELKLRIQQIYFDSNLKSLMATMKKNHGFIATGVIIQAIEFDHVELVRLLLDEGIDANIRVGALNGQVALISAAKSVEMLKLLVEAGAQIDVLSDQYLSLRLLTPLHAAIVRQDVEIIRGFLHAGADINICYEIPHGGNMQILECAIRADNGPLIKLLLDAGGKFSGYIKLPRYLTCIELNRHQAFPSELLFAIAQHATEVTKVLTTRSSYMAKTRAGEFSWAALRDAAKCGQLEIIELLLESGTDVDASSHCCDEIYAGTYGEAFAFEVDYGYCGVPIYPTAPHIAAVEKGNFEVVRKLIINNADVNAITFGFHGSCPLESAMVLGHDKVTRILIEAGASLPPLEPNGNRSRELVSAVSLRNTKRAIELVEVGTDPIYLLEYDWGSMKVGYLNIETTLLKIYSSVIDLYSSRTGINLFQLALDRKMYEFARLFITQTGNVNIPLRTNHDEQLLYPLDYLFKICNFDPLLTPIKMPSKWVDMINLLLEEGALINQPQRALVAAAKAGHLQILKVAVEVNSANFSPESLYESLVIAVHWGNREMIDYLLFIGAKVNTPTNLSMPSLITQAIGRQHVSSSRDGLIDLIKLFIERGTDVNARGPSTYGGRDSITALQLAARIGAQLVSFFIKNGADINIEGSEYTALQGAVGSGNIQNVLLLLESGADVNAPGPSWRQYLDALFWAASSGAIDLVQLLLNAGATSYGGAIEIASRRGHIVVVDMIVDWRDNDSKVFAADTEE